MIPERSNDKAMNFKIGPALRLAGRRVSEHIERFPIPVEDAMWVQRTGHSVAADGTVEPRIERPPSR
jgi:hypothetical protein